MPSTTLSLTALLSIMSSFQGTLGLPACSTADLGPESTVTLDEPVQATSTAVVSLATTLNPTVSPLGFRSESSDSVVQISPRTRQIAWVGVFDNDKCNGSPSNRTQLSGSDCHAIDINANIAEPYLGVFWGLDNCVELSAFDVWKKGKCHGKSSKKITIVEHPRNEPGLTCIKYPDAASAVRVTEALYWCE